MGNIEYALSFLKKHDNKLHDALNILRIEKKNKKKSTKELPRDYKTTMGIHSKLSIFNQRVDIKSTML